jgi:hypothetical protein
VIGRLNPLAGGAGARCFGNRMGRS